MFIMYRPRIFISAVTSEFATLRKQAADVLQSLGYEPVTQDLAGTDSGKLLDVLKEKIESCDGLIQIVGMGYGAEPPNQEIDGYGRVSYTQFEFLYANDLKEKKPKFETWVIVPREACTRDTPVEELDLVDKHENSLDHQSELCRLQELYLNRLREEGHLRHSPEDDVNFKNALLQLRDELKGLRYRYVRWQRGVAVALASILVILVVGGIFFWKEVNHIETLREGQKEIIANQQLSKDRILGHLISAADRVKNEALDDADKLKTYEERESAKEEAQKAYENSIARAKRLAEEFSVLDGTQKEDHLTTELARILEEEGIEVAFKFLEAERPSAFERASMQRANARRELDAYLKIAEVKAVNGELEAARAEYDRLLEFDDQWPDLLRKYSRFLNEQSGQTFLHGLLNDAIADGELALSLVSRIENNADKQDDLSNQLILCQSLNYLSGYLFTRAKVGDHDQAFTYCYRSLKIANKLYDSDPTSFRVARELLVTLDRLSEFLSNRGKVGDLDQALAYTKRSLKIAESLTEANPDSTWDACYYASMNERLGNFFFSRGQTGDYDQALSHYKQSLKIMENLYKADRSDFIVATHTTYSLNSLAEFLMTRSKAGDRNIALTYYERSLKISEELLKEKPDSALAASNLAYSLDNFVGFLSKRGQTRDLEKAYKYLKRSLEIREDLYEANPESASVAWSLTISLNSLGDFLISRDHLDDQQQALTHFKRFNEICEIIYKANPESSLAARNVLISLEKLGKTFSMRGQEEDLKQALACYERSLTIAEDIYQANPDSAKAAWDVSVNLKYLGDSLITRAQAGDVNRAISYYKRALIIAEDIYKANPDSAQAAMDVAKSLERLGYSMLTAQGNMDDLDQMLAYYQRSNQLYQSLYESTNYADTAWNFSTSLERLGDSLCIRGKSGDLDKAFKYYKQSLEIREDLYEANSYSNIAARNVSISLEKLGNVLLTRGKIEDQKQALEYYKRSLGIAKSIFEANPDTVEAAKDVLFILKKLVIAHNKFDELEEARSYRRAYYNHMKTCLEYELVFDQFMMDYYELLRNDFDK